MSFLAARKETRGRRDEGAACTVKHVCDRVCEALVRSRFEGRDSVKFCVKALLTGRAGIFQKL